MKIEINNYKSIRSEEVEVGNGKNIIYFVGRNESGKSNFLKAIEALKEESIDNKDKNFNNDDDIDIHYRWKVSKEIKNKWQKIGYKNDIIVANSLRDSWYYYPGYDEKINDWIYKKLNNNYDIPKDEEGGIFDSELLGSLKVLPGKKELPIKDEIIKLIDLSLELSESWVIHSFSDFDLIKKQYTFSEAIESPSFLGLWTLLEQKKDDIQKLQNLDKTSDEFIDLKNELQEKLTKELDNFISQFWKQKTIKFEINIEQEGFIIRAADEFIKNKNIPKYRSLDYRSDGMKHYLTLVLFINYVIQNKPNKRKIILLDEPDKLLHASAVIDLRKYLDKIANDDLVFVIATHNPFFIDEHNFHEISFVSKRSPEEGSIIIKNFARRSNDEEISTIQPFLTQIGIDTRSFIDLNNKKAIFVEGFHDYILLSSACKQLAKEKEYKYLEKVMFIMLGSSTKIPSIVNLSISFGLKLPFFIFDYDKGGNEGLKFYRKNGFIKNDLKNYTFINGYMEFDGDNNTKIETQNLFDDTLFNSKKISSNKNTNEFLEYSNKIKNKKIKLNEKTINELEKILSKIKKYYELK